MDHLSAVVEIWVRSPSAVLLVLYRIWPSRSDHSKSHALLGRLEIWKRIRLHGQDFDQDDIVLLGLVSGASFCGPDHT